MLKSKVSIFSVPSLITGILLGVSSGLSQAENLTTISVVGRGDPCYCGSHGGGFDATYNNRKISISFGFNPTPANPVKHPIVVLKNNKPVESWDSILCSFGDEKCPIAGSKIEVYGRWYDKTSFDAYKIWLK